MRATIVRVLLLISFAVPAAAQTTRLHESIVVTAAAEPVPFETAARSVWVLTRADIARLPVQSIEDLLRFASSVDLRARGAHAQTDISIRGGSFGQTLVLVDGLRMNDAQSGHHNSDIPLTLDDVERVEVLFGAGSSLFGADAFGGTVNIITRASDTTSAAFFAGEHGLGGGRVRASVAANGIRQSFSGELVRSSGFMPARDFESIAASSRTEMGRDTRLMIGHVRRDFGANGFYGPAPSHETTNQTMAALTHGMTIAGWKSSVQGMYRTHHDEFLYDPRVATAVPNRHRTHAGNVVVRSTRAIAPTTRATAGVELGADWIRSNNLGDHTFRRASGFFEAQQRAGDRLVLYPGLRYDNYSRFGSAWSPSLAARASVLPALSLRASAGRAFRIPTFTELYYRDPNHEAGGNLTPERGWSAEGGADWIAGSRLMLRGTVFTRRERDVIDWIRVSAAERWRTTNVRRVSTSGIELGARHLLGSAGTIDVQYSWLDTDAQALTGFLSKYVLDYASHNLAVSGTQRLAFGLEVGERIGWTRRNDGRSYPVVDLRASRAFRSVTVFVDGANLFDERYEEIKGVVMPGRWISAGVRLSVPSK